VREKVKSYVVIYFPDEGNNIVPPLSGGRFVITVTFVQNSTTYVIEVNTKL